MNSVPATASTARKNSPPAWRRQLPYWGAALLMVVITVGLWPAAVPVELGAVSRGPLTVTVDEEGMTRIKHRYGVTAPVAGQLRRIDWKAGAAVEAGKTVLAVLETAGADFLDARTLAATAARVQAAAAAREAAAAQQARAAATAKLFGADFARAKELLARNVFSRQEFDAAQMKNDTAAQDARSAEFALQVAEFELQQARALLTRGADGTTNAEPLVITSPVSGRILRRASGKRAVGSGGLPLDGGG
jgi:HlyD family secretion protein